jgi:NAD(P)-dependent dehydrogenase (short-subunit alcohol dehydrogenase family)
MDERSFQMLMKPSMSKTILITGASHGFGRDTAETLFRAGHTVYASMRGVQGKNREAAEALRKLGINTVDWTLATTRLSKRASRKCWRKPARSMCWSTTLASRRSA